MTLASRVSLFFLGSLAAVLAGFSAAVYAVASRHLGDRLQRRAESAVAMLTAAVEIKDDRVEWEPHERRLDTAGVRWVVIDDGGRSVDASAEPYPQLGDLDGDWPFYVRDTDGERWLSLTTRVAPADSGRPFPPNAGPRRDGHRGGSYRSLAIKAAVPAGADDASLRSLGTTLAGLGLAVWSAAALVGSRLCRRTLAPVSRMAESARSMRVSDPGGRLEVAATGDELEELGRSFNGLLARLDESHERQRRFTGEASHQLRTPLAVMLGQVEVALRRDRPADEYRRVLGVVGEQSSRLQRIVEMLLFLARADAESASPPLVPLELRSWLASHLAAWATHPRAADLRLAAGDACTAAAHAPLLGQAVDVLIDNALKYSPPGSEVVLSVRGEGGHVVLEVADKGGGIDPPDLPRVFEPFFRSPRLAADVGGAGLGLAIARRIMSALSGDIVAASGPGRGSRFALRLPATPASPE